MDSQGYLPFYTGIIQGEIDVDSPLLGASQNNPTSVSNSPPEVEITTSNKLRRSTSFSKQEIFREKNWQYFCQHNPYGTTCTTVSLSSRWRMINRETSIICGFIAALTTTTHSGTTEQDKKRSKKDFSFDHCWHVLKHQPKWSMPKKNSRLVLPPTPDSISIADRDNMSLVDDTTNFERLIGRKDVGKYLAKKMKVIKDLQEQEKESLHIKAERDRLEELRDKERIRLEELRDRNRIQFEEKRIRIEREKLHIKSMIEDERIISVDTSGMSGVQKLFYEQLQEGILARQAPSK
ncbi:hypothetical protein ACB092_06G078800 [Castanea dentata]